MAAAFRLIRRTLLCLLVGLTAFGVSGWILRPRARWEVKLPDDPAGYWFIALPQSQSIAWIGVRGDVAGGDVCAHAIDLNSSSKLCTVEAPHGYSLQALGVTKDGQLRVKYGRLDPDFKILECLLETRNPVTAESVSRTLADDWTICSDGERAWRTFPSGSGFKFEVVRLRDGAIQSELDFSGDRMKWNREQVAVSENADRLAICDVMRHDAVAPFGVEVWDVAARRPIKRLVPDRLSKNEGAVRTTFQSDGRIVGYNLDDVNGRSSSSRSFRRFDLLQNKYFEELLPAAPNEATGKPSVYMSPLGNAETLAVCINEERDYASFGVFDDFQGIQTVPWTSIPFILQLVGYEQGAAMSRSKDGGRQFVFGVENSHWSESIPERIREFLQLILVDNDVDIAYQWYDQSSAAWREVGCRQRADSVQVHADAFLAIVAGEFDGAWLLQSWPLPPRDPRLPALAIGIASAVGAWWLCARRFKRRIANAAQPVSS